jgi:outer membrane murein-binding lipoprotein Lpp
MSLLHVAKQIGSAVVAAVLLTGPAQAADDPGVSQLRNDIRTLEREVRELSRRVDQLQQGNSASATGAPVTRRSTAPDPDPSAWIAPEKWDRVRSGMTAQQVILVLGTPVSMRSDGNPTTQTLFYTLPIGDGGFLTGTVRLKDDKVLEVRKPVLK